MRVLNQSNYYLIIFSFSLLHKLAIFRFNALVHFMPLLQHLYNCIQHVDSLSVLFDIVVRVDGLFVLLLNPLTILAEHFTDIFLLLFVREWFPLVLQFILQLINQTFVLILHVIKRDDPFIILYQFFLYFLHLDPLLFFDLVEVINHKPSHQTLRADDLVLVIDEDHLVWSVDANVSDRLRGDFVLVMNV